jgi:hypothetical protein
MKCSLCADTGFYTTTLIDYGTPDHAPIQSEVPCDMCDFDWKAYVREHVEPECLLCNDTGLMADEEDISPCIGCDEGAKRMVLRHMRRTAEIDQEVA